jgi:hypothetical protein
VDRSNVTRYVATLFFLLCSCFVVACSKKSEATNTSFRRTDPASTIAQAAPDAAFPGASPSRSGAASAPPSSSTSFDAGVNTCHLIFGPIQEPWTGDAALVPSEGGIELIVHRSGVPSVTRLALPSLRTPSVGKVVLETSPERVSSRPCAVGADQIFCMDPHGAIVRTPRSGGTGRVVGKGRPGTRLAAATLSGSHALVAYLADGKAAGAIVSEAYAVVDDAPPVRVSEEGSGATAVSAVPRDAGVVVMLVDGRAAMTPVHARNLGLKDGRLDVGADAVAFVGGGAERHTSGVLAGGGSGDIFALVPVASETGFGAVAVHLGDPPAVDEKTTWSMYPNGLDPAPIAATTGSFPIRVARVRPIDARPDAPRGVELGKLDDSGAFVPYGMISTTGRVSALEIAADAAKALWIYYTDAAGSWLERRACP